MQSEDWWRGACFVGVFAAMAAAELLMPRRARIANTSRRWLSNLALAGLNTLVVRLIAPAGAVGVAMIVAANGWGLLHALALPEWLAVILAVVVLDFVIYLQHVLFHALPFLWRLHRVHHADLDLDATSGLRFHTLEIVISLGIKLAVVILLGAPALAVLIFEVALNATSMFNHANLKLPRWLDALMRLVLVTPDMHRVHHSANPAETNANFGFNLPWWDFLLGTYLAQPEKSHEEMTLGLPEVRDERLAEALPWMLWFPFANVVKGDAPAPKR